MAMRIGKDTSCHQVLRAQCSAPRIAADDRHCSRFNTDKGQLCHIWFSPDAKQVGRHHFFIACKSLSDYHIPFNISTFSILNLMASYPSTTAYTYDITTPVAARYDRSGAPMLVYTSDFHVVVATSLSPDIGPAEKRSLACLAPCSTALELVNTAICDGIDGLRAMDDLIGQYICI